MLSQGILQTGNLVIYGTNHPQLKRYTCVTRVCVTHICKSKKHAQHQTTHVHACKINAHAHALISIQTICHKMILLTASSALSFIIYACKTILGGIVTDILGHPRHTAFVALVASWVLTQLTHITRASYIHATYILHFFISGQFKWLSRKP